MNTIISTKPYPCSYAKFDVNIESHTKRKVWEVRINGGSGVMQGKGHIYTPDGVATSIDDEGLNILMTIPQFKRDIERGYMKVIRGESAKRIDADEEANKDMNMEHGSKPLTDKDFLESGAKIDKEGNIDVTGSDESNESVAKKVIRRRGKRN